MKTYVFDIDGTICNNTFGQYEKAKPFLERINFINDLFKKGNKIKYFTARGSSTGLDWRQLTENQLKEWGALYHELILKKPEGDIYIDDKAFNSEQWLFPEENISIDFKDDKYFKESISNQIEILNNILNDEEIFNQINSLCLKIRKCLLKNGKIILAGNGGSFSDSQHLAAEFVCKFHKDRKPLPAIALGTNSSNLTAIGNDYGFDYVFSRELEAIGKEEDILLAFSTSGNSENIYNLIKKSESLKIPFYIFSGSTGGKLSEYNDLVLKIPSAETATIQQLHILLGHIICKKVEVPFL